ncbi:hypothetical protein ACHRXQ_10685 [Neisseria sp. 23W00734]
MAADFRRFGRSPPDRFTFDCKLLPRTTNENIFSARAFAVLLAASALIAANIAQAEPTTEEKKQAVRAAIKAARAEACDAGFEKIMVQSELPQPVYLVL